MNQVRTFLLFAWLLIGFLLWEAWQKDYVYPPAPPLAAEPTALPVDAGIPGAEAVSAGAAVPQPEGAAPIERETVAAVAPITITTDLLRLRVDPRGVSILSAELLRYPQTTAAGAPPVELLSQQPGHAFTAQVGWVSAQGDAPSHQAVFESAQSDYAMDADSGELQVDFRWNGGNGLSLQRSLVFTRGSYAIEVRESLRNGGGEVWRGNAYRQLLREPPPAKGGGFTNPEAYSFVGAAWYSAADKFNKIAFDDFDPKLPLNANGSDSWVAMLQHYFFAAWIPEANESSRLSTGVLDHRLLIRALSPAVELAPGAEHQDSAQLYIGPKLQEQLATIAPGLELAVDYGVLTLIAEPLFWLLSLFHGLLGNWGWAIILLVVLIKAAFFKLSEAQYRSFAKMRQVQPRIESLKERYGDDRQKFNMAMMELYKKEKINPMGGCLPILLQIPVFISLYWVLLESVELRHAPWILWIQNLTAPDPYFVLPVLNLATMWLTQKLSPTPGMDPLQKKMMQAMPLVFGVMFAFFPAGLVLYWTVNGGLGLLQQWLITKRHSVAAKA